MYPCLVAFIFGQGEPLTVLYVPSPAATAERKNIMANHYKMKTRKTSSKSRGIYTYEFNTGEKVVLWLNKNGITEEFIKELHKQDDREVENNNKAFGVEVIDTNDNSKKKRLYHERFEYSAEMELDFENDKRRVQLETSFINPADSTSTLVRRLWLKEIAAKYLTVNQKKIVYLLYKGYKSTEIAQFLGVSDAAITKTKKAIAEIIRTHS